MKFRFTTRMTEQEQIALLIDLIGDLYIAKFGIGDYKDKLEIRGIKINNIEKIEDKIL